MRVTGNEWSSAYTRTWNVIVAVPRCIDNEMNSSTGQWSRIDIILCT